MPMNREYASNEPARAEIDALTGPALVEFGTPWCGHCIAAQPLLEQVLAAHAGLKHFKIEDGPGRPLGRSFRVKLWPTLVFIKDGVEVERLVRPSDEDAIRLALARIAPA